MAKKKKHSGRRFAIGVLIYAVILLGAAGAGLGWLWGFLESYEASRPYLAIDAYMEGLTREHIVSECEGLIGQVDTNIQSGESCRQIMLEALAEDITYARKASECTEDRQVFVLRSGKQVVGKFSIITTEENKHGFKPWTFEQEEFDLSFLLDPQPLSVTVPAGYPVSVNGVVLDERYIVSTETEEYALLEHYYDDYQLPMFTLHTYEAGPFLGGGFTMEVTAPDGQPFTYDESFDRNALLHNVDGATAEELDDFVEEFVEIYVVFAGCANDDRYSNYAKVTKYVVPGSKLAKRMLEALDGMQYAQSKGDKVAEIRVNHYVELAEDTYLCDVTYLVDTTGKQGVVQTTTNTQMVVVRRDGKLLVESLMGY